MPEPQSAQFANAESISVKHLKSNQSYEVSLTLSPEQCATVAADLELLKLRKARLVGRLSPAGAEDWQLEARLGATVEQPCVVTLAPVTTRIDEELSRRFVRLMPDLPEDEEEIEMPEDDSIEPLGHEIALLSVFREALSLALPPYPRADGAELGEAVYTQQGLAPMRDEDTKPFAGLAALRDKLQNGEGSADDES